jgi:hypothetical protein
LDGLCWSSSYYCPSQSAAKSLRFSSSDSQEFCYPRLSGGSVRCVKNL